MLIEFPNGWMNVKIREGVKNDLKIKQGISQDEYISLMTKDEDFKNIIKSIRPINSN